MVRAKILCYGDLHLNSKGYGAHVDYPTESLDILKKITKLASEYGVSHIIGLGDLSFSRFTTIEYRIAVEEELGKQYSICDGRHYELKGNHDIAPYGMTEYDYFVSRGLLKTSCNLDIGNTHITMFDYGRINKTTPNINSGDGHINIAMVHDFVSFADLDMPNFGKAIELDNQESLFGTDYIIAGHIHTSRLYRGSIHKSIDGTTYGHELILDYPGSMTRPAYRDGAMDEVGHVVLLTIGDTPDEFKYERLDVELEPLDKIFNLDLIDSKKEKKELKENRVDISDVVNKLASHNRNIGDPEDIIKAMTDVPEKYKNKAIELLKLGQ